MIRGGGGVDKGKESITDYTRATKRDAACSQTKRWGGGGGSERCSGGAVNIIKGGRLWKRLATEMCGRSK